MDEEREDELEAEDDGGREELEAGAEEDMELRVERQSRFEVLLSDRRMNGVKEALSRTMAERWRRWLRWRLSWLLSGGCCDAEVTLDVDEEAEEEENEAT